MGVRGKSYWEWEYATYCDYGNPNHRTRITRHFSKAAAIRAFKRWRTWYSHEGGRPERHLWRCWQEKRSTNEIINDTGSVWHTTTPTAVA